jgi:hypothetical protein
VFAFSLIEERPNTPGAVNSARDGFRAEILLSACRSFISISESERHCFAFDTRSYFHVFVEVVFLNHFTFYKAL